MELYGSFTSPFARHIHIALRESALPFQFIETDAAGSAKLSPTQKVPFLTYTENGQQKMLTDSSAILKYVREKSGQHFFHRGDNVLDLFNAYCTANTLMDSSINLFYMEKDGITPQQSAYLARQQARVQTGLADLEKLALADCAPYNDAELRIACYLDWALFRQRLSLEGFPRLQRFLNGIRQYAHFAETAPKG